MAGGGWPPASPAEQGLMERNAMQDRMIERTETSPEWHLPAVASEAGFGLEPLAVPLGRVTSILRRHALIICLTFLAVVGGTVFVVKQLPKEFTATATILIEPQRTQVSDLQAISSDPGDVASLMRTQIDILQSQSIALGVVRALHLTENPEFSPKGGGLLATIRSLVSNPMHLLSWTTRPAGPPELPSVDAAEQMAAGILGQKLSFGNEARSSVLNVLVTTRDPALSATIANEVARQFLDFKRREKFEAMQRAHDWFQDQMGKLAEQVNAADRAVEQYRQEHGLDEQPLNVTNGAGTETVNRQQLNAISAQLAQVSRDLALKQGQLAQAQAVARGEASPSTLPAVLTSSTVNQVLDQISTAQAAEAQLAASEGAGNPDLVAARARVHKLQARVGQEMANVVNSLTTELKASRAQEQLLRGQMEKLRSAVSGENEAEIGLQGPLTKARATRSIYQSFLTRATQLANVAGIQEPDASLVASATPPLGPSGPKKMRLTVVAAAVALVLAATISCLIERLRGGFSLPEQVEGVLGLPLIAQVPRVSRKVLRGQSRGRSAIAFTASLDKLRGQLRAMGKARPRLVMVTSALPSEGKSVFAASLARNTAEAGWRVLLIECDFGRPTLAAQFGIPPAPGLSDMLVGQRLGDDTQVIREPSAHLHVIVAGGERHDPQEMLASDRMTALLTSVRDKYDMVVLDTPPVLPVADAQVLAGLADATLMVVRWEKTSRVAVRNAVRLIRENGAYIMGAVLTQIDPRVAALSGGSASYAFTHYDYYHSAGARRFLGSTLVRRHAHR